MRALPLLLMLSACREPMPFQFVAGEGFTLAQPQTPDPERGASAPDPTLTAIDSGPPDSPVETGDGGPDRPTSFLVILTDDQRADAMWMMDGVNARLAANGAVFTNAYVNTPLCCPTRASWLSGGFRAGENGVLANGLPNGGITRFDDRLALPVRFHAAGYQTALVGKYLNEYNTLIPYVPPGWSSFSVPITELDWSTFPVVEGGDGEGQHRDHTGYLTDYLHDRAELFLRDLEDHEPFLLWMTHLSPHHPGTPADRHAGQFDGYTLRGDAFNEADLSDKPSCIQSLGSFTDEEIAEIDADYAHTMESLLAVDESVSGLMAVLGELGRLDDTVVIFASDNGYLWGEHRGQNKGLPYQESIRVPLIISEPGGFVGEIDELTSVSTDLPATLYDMAGIDARSDGLSLVPLLQGVAQPNWREWLFIEAWNITTCPDYSGMVNNAWKYVEYTDGTGELYDLVADPFELESLFRDPDYADRVAEFSELLAPEKSLTITSDEMLLVANESSSHQLKAWGGTPPYVWSIRDGTLPPGLELTDDGQITGSSVLLGGRNIEFAVSDATPMRYNDAPRVVHKGIWFEVIAPDDLPESPAPAGAPLARSVDGATEIEIPLTRSMRSRVAISPSPGLDMATRSLWAEADDGGATVRVEGLQPGQRYYLHLEGVRELFEFVAPE